MKTCPWCGKENMDSDEHCFHCGKILDVAPEPDEEKELRRERERARIRRPPSLARLIAVSFLRKVFFLLLAVGAFFLLALLAIWVSYDSTTAALVVLAFLGAALLFGLYYPDVTISRRIGTRGVIVSLVSNLVIVGGGFTAVLFFLSARGYIGGVLPAAVKIWWAPVIVLFLGLLLSWLVGRKAAVREPLP